MCYVFVFVFVLCLCTLFLYKVILKSYLLRVLAFDTDTLEVLVNLLYVMAFDSERIFLGFLLQHTLQGQVVDFAAFGAEEVGVGHDVAIDVYVVLVDAEHLDSATSGEGLHVVIDGGAGEAGVLGVKVVVDGIDRGMGAVLVEIIENHDTRLRHSNSEISQTLRSIHGVFYIHKAFRFV